MHSLRPKVMLHLYFDLETIFLECPKDSKEVDAAASMIVFSCKTLHLKAVLSGQTRTN